jgi:hypothetical protein
MYGKIFESLYNGSMVGSGSPTFAVWTYVIAKMRPDSMFGAVVELNPEVVAFLLGEKPDVVESVIGRLQEPDPKSTSKKEEGRRLVRVGQFAFRVVNGAEYMAIRNEEDRREYFRRKKAESRANKSKPSPGESEFVKADAAGDTASADAIVEAHLPKPFHNPSLEEVRLACAKAGLPDSEGEKFFNYYESNGWRVGRNKMRSMPHALANWKSNWNNGSYANKSNHRTSATYSRSAAENPRNAGVCESNTDYAAVVAARTKAQALARQVDQAQSQPPTT